MNNIMDWILSQMWLVDAEEEAAKNPDAQGMMNFICGGLYALEGDVTVVGENVFMVTAWKNSQC